MDFPHEPIMVYGWMNEMYHPSKHDFEFFEMEK